MNNKFYKLFFKILLELPCGVIVTDNKNIVIDLNQQACVISRFKKSDIIHRPLQRLIEKKYFEGIIHNEISKGKIKTSDGRTINVEFIQKEVKIDDEMMRFIVMKENTEIIDEKRASQVISIFESIDEIIYVSDPETYEVLYLNKAGKRFFKDAIGNKCYKVFQKLDKPCDFCTNKFIFNSKRDTYIWRFQNIKTGKWFHCIDKKIPWTDGRPVRYEMAIDITDQIMAEHKLHENEKRFRLLFENMKNAVIIYSIDDKVKNIVIKDLNRSCEKIEKVKKNKIVGKRIEDVFPGVKEFGIYSKIKTVHRTGRSVFFPVSFYKDERICGWRENYLFPLGKNEVVAVYEDLTEKKIIEAKLLENERMLSNLMKNIPGMAFKCRNDKHWTMRFCSRGTYGLTGYKADDFIDGKALNYSDIIHPQDTEYVWLTIQNAFNKSKKYYKLMYRIITKNGKVKYVFEQGVGIVNKNKVLEIEGIIIDITKQKLFEMELQDLNITLEKKVQERTETLEMFNEELRATQEEIADMNSKLELMVNERTNELKKTVKQLEDANVKLKALDDLKSNIISNISHEMRTPFISIKGYLEILLNEKGGKLKPTQKDNLERIRKSTKKLEDLVENFLSFSNIHSEKESLEIKKFNMIKTIDRLVAKFRKSNMKNITFKTEFSQKSIMLSGDEEKLVLSFKNLLDNSVKFSPANSRVNISVSKFKNDFVIDIKDKGIGISKKYVDKIFDPFFQVDPSSKREFQGAGMGLTLANDIIKLHNGNIQVIPGRRGVTFRITLPLKK